MSTIAVNAITDAAGGNTATINGMTPTADSLQGFRNRILNGGMVIDQRNAGAAVTVDGASAYTVDRFFAQDFSDAVLSVQQIADAPTGFVNSLRVTVTTADASLGATQGDRVGQRIEGFNVSDFGWGTANAQAVTLSFWVKSSLTGTFGGSFQNSAGNRAYPFTYSISAANTWEQKSITVTGDTTGTWLTTNGQGILINWSLGMGSTYSGTAGAWAAADLLSATGSVSVVGTLSATWQITGVQLEAGSVATPFERRPYGTELALCQRYYARLVGFASGGQLGLGMSTGSTGCWGNFYTPQPLRATPTVSFSNIACSDQTNYGLAITAIAGSGLMTTGGGIAFTNSAGATQYRPAFINSSSTSGYVDFSAEL